MEHAFVIDASVAVKMFLDEEYSDHAVALIEDSIATNRSLFAPLHFPSEVSNAIHKQQRQSSITHEEANSALSRFFRLPVTIVSSPELYQRALTFAHDHSLRTIYDSLYVVLAEALDVEFWTDDRRLITDLGASANWVRWIGDYQIPSNQTTT